MEKSLGLSREQQEVLKLITEEFLTSKAIAVRRGTSVQAVNKTIRKIKAKGFLEQTTRGFQETRGTPLKPPIKRPKIRLHGMEFRARILYDSKFYQEARRRGDWLVVDGHKVRLHKSSVEIYEGENHWFDGEEAQQVTSLANHYWHRFFTRLESRLRIIILKSGSQNVSLVKHHYAEVGNELAKDSRKNHRKLRVFTTDDGKLWLMIDYSFRKDELETQHRDSAQQDMEKAVAFFNDLRDHNPPLNSELAERMMEIMGAVEGGAKNHKEIIGTLEGFAVAMREHLKLVKSLQDVAEGLKAAQASSFQQSHNGVPIIDRLFQDEAFRERFEAATREEQDHMLGLK